MAEADFHSAVSFAYEMGVPKRLPRAGWVHAGVASPESVADHSFRVAILASIIAIDQGADPDRAAVLGLFHDVSETRVGDVPLVGKPYVRPASPEAVIADQTARLAVPVATHFRGVVSEFEEGATPESQCARDADRLDLLLQAREYQAAGNVHMTRFIESSTRAPFNTAAGKGLADAALIVSPDDWWESAATASPHWFE